MLVEFSVANFLSIKDRQTLRLDASSISEHQEQLINAGRYKLLRSAVIYGANASGKSNVLKAMAAMNRIVATSAERSSTTEIDVEPFLLSTETEFAPSYFEVLFLIDENRYRYGFEVDRKAVRTEWLYVARKKREKLLFLRQNDGINVSREFKEGKGLEDKTRDNALFLAVCDQFNGIVAKQLLGWFARWLPISGIGHDNYTQTLYRLLDVEQTRDSLVEVIKRLDFGFSDLRFQKEEIDISHPVLSNFSGEQQKSIFNSLGGQLTIAVKTVHTKYSVYNEAIESVIFDLKSNESDGTNKFFDLLAPIHLALTHAGILIVDELDAKLHPLMTQAIIRLFNQPEINPRNAQLIFATHDTNLLSAKLFRRDQVYFTEKDKYEATSLYSLVEYQEEDGKKVRNDRSFEDDYIRGRYGAIPFIGDLSKIISQSEGIPEWLEK